MIWGYCSFLSLVESDDDCDFFMWLKRLIIQFKCNVPFLLGFGDHIDWKTYSEGLKEAQSRWSFLFIVIEIVYVEFKNLFANFSEVTVLH